MRRRRGSCARRGSAGGELLTRAPMQGMDPLDALATDLRERLLAGAGEDGGDLPGRIRALVDREAGVLCARTGRAELAARIAERAFGLGPLEPLLADPAVDEIMVSGTRAGVGRAARAAGGDRRALRARGRPARRDRADPRAAGPPRRRGRAAVRRAPAGRLARERRAAAAGARRARADDPPLPPARVRARRPGRERDADRGRCSTSSRARCARARRSSSAAAPAPARRRR